MEMEPIDTIKKNEESVKIEKPQSIHSLSTGLIASIVLVSVLAGAAGGIFATRGKGTLGSLSSTLSGSTQVSEDSAIVDVVHKASPAVVSVIISKDLNAIQNQAFNSPFFFDPFFQFRSPVQQQPQNTTPQYQQTGAGSGFFITSDGLILTNKHVVSDTTAKYSVLTTDGKKYDAKVVAIDPVNDLALIKVEISNAPTLKLADSSKIEIGQRAVAIGNSLGQYSNTVTTGIVSGIGRNITAGGEGVSEQLEGVIQTDAAINPGNSGGPLLNIFGDVIGVNTAFDQQGQLVGFAIPANDVQKAVESYQKNGKIIRPFLGIRYQLIDPILQSQNNLSSDHGAWVVSGQESDGSISPGVVPGSAADKAGVKEGDIVLSVNGENVDSNNTLAGLLKKYNPGDKLTLQILRGKQTLTLSLTLGSK